MTRSRKKTPCCHCAGKDNTWKKIYNRRLRRIPNIGDDDASTIPDGGYYRKMNCTWNISDLKCTHATIDDYYYPGEDEAEMRNSYEHDYIRK